MNNGGRDRIPTSASDLGLSKLEPLQWVDGMGLLLSRLWGVKTHFLPRSLDLLDNGCVGPEWRWNTPVCLVGCKCLKPTPLLKRVHAGLQCSVRIRYELSLLLIYGSCRRVCSGRRGPDARSWRPSEDSPQFANSVRPSELTIQILRTKGFFIAIAADPPPWGKTRIEFFTGPNWLTVDTLCKVLALYAEGS